MKQRLLVIDDEADFSELLRYKLERKGFEVFAAFTASEGLRQSAELHFDAIILDVMLPDIDGFSLCEKLRKIPATATVPIIVFSILDSLEFHRRGTEAGVTTYIPKSKRLSELEHCIEKLASESTCDVLVTHGGS